MPVIPPTTTWSREAEAALLGAVLLDTATFHEVSDLIEPDSFWLEAHRQIWRAMQAIVRDGMEVDIVTCTQRLKDMGKLESAGGLHYVASLTPSVPTAANAPHYALIIAEQAAKRRCEMVAADVLEAIHKDLRPDEIWAKFEAGLSAATQDNVATGAMSQSTVIAETLHYLENTKIQNGVVGYSTGLGELDEVSGGLQESHLVVIAARPAMGKSALGLQLSAVVARQILSEANGGQVIIASLEMSRRDLCMRLLAMSSRVASSKIRTLSLTDAEVIEVQDAAARISSLPISYLDEGVFTPALLLSRIRREHARKPVRLVMVDYLQLMDQPKAESREAAIATCSRALKAMARTLNCPVIALAQLNRQCEMRNDKRPVLADLRNSGAIEQDADQVWFLYRQSYYSNEATDLSAEIKVAKNRSGRTGTISLVWDPTVTMFRAGFSI